MSWNAVTIAFGTRLWLWKSFTVVDSATATVVGMSVDAVLRHAKFAGPRSVGTVAPDGSLFAWSATFGLLKPMSIAGGASGVGEPLQAAKNERQETMWM